MKPVMPRIYHTLRTAISTTDENTYITMPKGQGRHRRILSTEQMELLIHLRKRRYVCVWFFRLYTFAVELGSAHRTFDECEQVTATDSVSTIFASEVLNGPMLGLFETVFKMHTKGVVRRSFVALAVKPWNFFSVHS